jgi:hypothetical protein
MINVQQQPGRGMPTFDGYEHHLAEFIQVFGEAPKLQLGHYARLIAQLKNGTVTFSRLS